MITLVSIFRNIGPTESSSVKVFTPGAFEEKLLQAASLNEPLFVHIKGNNADGKRFSFVFNVAAFITWGKRGKTNQGWWLPVTNEALAAYANDTNIRKV